MGRDAEAALKAAFESVAADVGEEELSRADLWLSIKSNNSRHPQQGREL